MSSSILPILGVVVGGVAGFAIGGPAGAAIGAGLGGSLGSSVAGASTQSGLAKSQESLAGLQQYESSTIFGEQQGYESQLNKLIADPSSVTSLPGYQFNLSQGEQSVARQFGPQAGSGAEGAALTQYGQNYAMNTFNQQSNLLMNLAGINVNPAGGLAASSSSLSGASAATTAGNNQIQQLLAALTFAGGSGILSGSSFNPGGYGSTLSGSAQDSLIPSFGISGTGAPGSTYTAPTFSVGGN